jgi:hypothetical protein
VTVQIASFGNSVKEGEKQGRLLADGIEIAGGFLLGSLGRGQRGKNDQNDIAAIDVGVQGRPPGNSGL